MEIKKGSHAPFLSPSYVYLQEDGAHLALDDVQTQLEMALPEIVGVKVTLKSFAARIVPLTTIVPAVGLMVIPVARLVGTKPVAQVSRLALPLTDTASVTQVRAPLAAKITSDAFARLV